ncbi:MAG TPA: hypothetical protein VHV74_11210 [Pseudonocardiaceae bacterium]|nr:hypothetical protein [Pseudonocardiaceae bacterium]
MASSVVVRSALTEAPGLSEVPDPTYRVHTPGLAAHWAGTRGQA